MTKNLSFLAKITKIIKFSVENYTYDYVFYYFTHQKKTNLIISIKENVKKIYDPLHCTEKLFLHSFNSKKNTASIKTSNIVLASYCCCILSKDKNERPLFNIPTY